MKLALLSVTSFSLSQNAVTEYTIHTAGSAHPEDCINRNAGTDP
jgi:hypothetical protein